MNERFAEVLTAGGHANSLGRVNEVIKVVLDDKSRLDELYDCLFEDDAWVRMRAADALEKICREQPEWLLSYIDRFPKELAVSSQPSIQWHLAQIYREVELTSAQKQFAAQWLEGLLSTKEVDWIVAANAMDTLAQFVKDGSFPEVTLKKLLAVQQQHKSKSVVRRADKLLTALS
ncbi:MAG TPA: hypothetical protein VLG09_06005 [Candidatus Saccharimonadales bacterium]|nr:hypothetical protein [Candidatus Saccharimonadales bacterium]